MDRFRDVTPRLPVADLQRTIDFYTGRLGFRTEVLWPRREPTFCILDRDRVHLGFYVRDGRGRPRGEPGAAELYLDVSDVAGLHERLSGELEIEWGPEVYSYGRREFAVRDPDGYLLIFSEPSDGLVTCRVESSE